MEHLKVIKTPDEHNAALSRLDELMDSDPAEGSQVADELELLAMLIEQYEAAAFPVDMPSPIDAILFRMDQQGLKKKDLVPYIGSAPKVSDVLNGKRPLSLTMIRRLHEGLGIPAEVLIQDVERHQHYANDVDFSAYPLAEIRKRGYLPDFTGSLSELKEYAGDHLSAFFASVGMTPQSPSQPMMLRTSAHQRSNDKECDAFALQAWQARVLHIAAKQKIEHSYTPGTVTQEWMLELARQSWSRQGPAIAVEYLNKAGIKVIFEPHLPKTYLDGAVCLSDSRQPVVALTLRHDRLDNFWFTLMHELAHIALHFDGNESWFLDDLDAPSSDPKEDEADALAQEVLIPAKEISNGLPTTEFEVEALASRLKVTPCIVAGRVRRTAQDYKIFGRKFRSDKTVGKVLTAAGYLQ
ncbi:MAG: ImmA/IrrE family metallo-endopeptidase [Pseudomonadota bacterium]|nr:ImmA/IrrE family metallo-endopeptidase [Pseudomonadota bacterium]